MHLHRLASYYIYALRPTLALSVVFKMYSVKFAIYKMPIQQYGMLIERLAIAAAISSLGLLITLSLQTCYSLFRLTSTLFLLQTFLIIFLFLVVGFIPFPRLSPHTSAAAVHA